MTTNCECGAVGLPGSEVVHGSPLCRDCAERLHNDPHDFDHAEVPFGRCVLCELLGVDQSPARFADEVQRVCSTFARTYRMAGPIMATVRPPTTYHGADEVTIILAPGDDMRFAATTTVGGYEWDTVEGGTLAFVLGRATRDLPTVAELDTVA